MAKVQITLTDRPDGGVGVDILAHEVMDTDNLTDAQYTALEFVARLSEGGDIKEFKVKGEKRLDA